MRLINICPALNIVPPRCHKISNGIALVSSHVGVTSRFGHFVSDVGDCRCLALVVQSLLSIICCKSEDN